MSTLEYIENKYNLDLGQRIMPIDISNQNREDLAVLFAELGFKAGVEVGTEQGVYAEILCKNIPGLKLFCVDAWTPYPAYKEHISQDKLNTFYKITKNRLKRFDCHLIRKFSMDAVTEFADNSLDFIYVDANHEFRHVVDDISSWSKKVRVGGIISGHDYIRRKNPSYAMHVVDAVIGYTNAYQIRPWFVMGSKHPLPDERRDRPRSWLWVKEK